MGTMFKHVDALHERFLIGWDGKIQFKEVDPATGAETVYYRHHGPIFSTKKTKILAVIQQLAIILDNRKSGGRSQKRRDQINGAFDLLLRGLDNPLSILVYLFEPFHIDTHKIASRASLSMLRDPPKWVERVCERLDQENVKT